MTVNNLWKQYKEGLASVMSLKLPNAIKKVIMNDKPSEKKNTSIHHLMDFLLAVCNTQKIVKSNGIL